MQDDDEPLEPAAAALAEAADAVSAARRVLAAKVVGVHRAGVPLSRIARYTGLHPIALRHLLAAAGEPLAPAWPEPGRRPRASDRDGIPTRSPEQPTQGTGTQHAARPAAVPHGGTVMVVLLGRPGRLGGMVLLYRRP